MLHELAAQFYSYFIHLFTGIAVLWLFSFVYLRVTPFDELRLIRDGHLAAALSFGGALLGFSLTFASSIIHNATIVGVVAWALTAMLVQIATYYMLAYLTPRLKEQLERNNIAVGALMGLIALVIGIINAASLS